MLLYCKTCYSFIVPIFKFLILFRFMYELTVIILVYQYVLNIHVLYHLCKPQLFLSPQFRYSELCWAVFSHVNIFVSFLPHGVTKL